VSSPGIADAHPPTAFVSSDPIFRPETASLINSRIQFEMALSQFVISATFLSPGFAAKSHLSQPPY
jgi:hypothetical protein